MSQIRNNKLPMIMLPIAMIVAGLVSSAPTTVFNIAYPVLQNNLGIVIDTTVMLVVSNAIALIGSIGYVVVIILFSLSCKGLQKKLCFVISILVSRTAQILLSGVIFVTSILLSLIPNMDYTIQNLIFSGSNAIGGVLEIIVEFLVAIFFFKYLSSFVEKEVDEEDEPYKVKPLKPSIVVVGYGVLSLVVGLADSAIYTALTQGAFMLKNTYLQNAISHGTSIVSSIILWVALIGATFLFKDKYQKLTIVGSVIAGQSIWGFIGIIFNFITIFLPTISGVVNFFSIGITNVLGIATGILIYYLANKKQYERIKK